MKKRKNKQLKRLRDGQNITRISQPCESDLKAIDACCATDVDKILEKRLEENTASQYF